ncbi:helix-turn-helix domain-containing protein [Streptomyces litchfieldiae]|uniref:Helix-turn-helix transcriptional regulator n=1 Tax=Streptomyces litchfieldiae TaxID=3075543 RepID=A0ABU2N064_9ACTN|nr:helix-turn-helix transcriptional regulator [Streptomyces sp. DSM 44938]MDT0347285.1 helix-turn-helix transcriptional regulator [Streptomyces sp. DSM 44938]
MASTFRSRRLGADLRRLREEAALSSEFVANEMGFSRPKLNRIECGEVRVAQNDLKALLKLYGVDDEASVGAFIVSAREAKRPGWWQAFQDTIPRTYADYIALEAAATEIKNWEPTIVPGLLQTEAYARAVIHANPAILSPADVDDLVKVLHERQVVLDREPPEQPPRLWAVIGESAIRQTVGGVKVMREQLTHLGELTERQHIVLQVLPHTAGAHAGLTGAFVVFGLPRDPDVVSVENMTGTLYMDQPGERRGYNDAFDHLRATALNPADSLALIQRAAKEMQE